MLHETCPTDPPRVRFLNDLDVRVVDKEDHPDNKTGYFGVCHSQSRKAKPYVAQVKYGGKQVHLGSFATAEEAALFVARTPEGQEAAKRAAAPAMSGGSCKKL